MARRRSRTRTIYRKARGGYRKRKGLIDNNLMISAAAGFGSKYIPQVLGKWTNPAVFMGLGYVMKKKALMNIGAYEAGRMIGAGGIGGLFGGNGNGGVR